MIRQNQAIFFAVRYMLHRQPKSRHNATAHPQAVR